MKPPHIALLGSVALLLVQAHAAVVQDIASNYGGSFVNGSNGGTGFLPWAVSNNHNGTTIFAGSFTGDSTAGAGNINTTGVSFGLFANPAAAFVNVTRDFTSTLITGDVFSFNLAANFDNGNKGFDLFAGSDGTVLNFNIGGGAGVSSSRTLTPDISVVYDYGGNDAVIAIAIRVLSSSSFSYQISRMSALGTQGSLFTGTVSGLTQSIGGFGLYVAGTDAGGLPQNNLYFNNLEVVPEPSASLLVVLGGIACAMRRRVRR